MKCVIITTIHERSAKSVARLLVQNNYAYAGYGYYYGYGCFCSALFTKSIR